MPKKKSKSTPVYYTTFQVAKFLGVSVPTVVNWVNNGWLRAHRTPGGHRRISRREVLAFAKEKHYPLPPELLGAEGGPKRILVVDDDPDIALLIREFLEREGHFVVEVAHSGFEAGFKVRSETPHLIVLDIRMPGMDGFEVHRMLCADPETSHIPVLACTAFRDEDMNRRLAESAFAGVVEKPLDWATFAAEVRAHLT